LEVVFFLAAAVAVLATVRVISCSNAVHALLYFIVSLLAVAIVFFVLGAPFVAALEVIVNAGAIMVLFLFAVMLLGLDRDAAAQERRWMPVRVWIGPCLLVGLLGAELFYLVLHAAPRAGAARQVGPQEVGADLLGPYLVAVEIASLLLLAAVVATLHLSRRTSDDTEEPAP
jgi:NADH-quinone oxidoreductase subunit J